MSTFKITSDLLYNESHLFRQLTEARASSREKSAWRTTASSFSMSFPNSAEMRWRRFDSRSRTGSLPSRVRRGR